MGQMERGNLKCHGQVELMRTLKGRRENYEQQRTMQDYDDFQGCNKDDLQV